MNESINQWLWNFQCAVTVGVVLTCISETCESSRTPCCNNRSINPCDTSIFSTSTERMFWNAFRNDPYTGTWNITFTHFNRIKFEHKITVMDTCLIFILSYITIFITEFSQSSHGEYAECTHWWCLCTSQGECRLLSVIFYSSHATSLT